VVLLVAVYLKASLCTVEKGESRLLLHLKKEGVLLLQVIIQSFSQNKNNKKSFNLQQEIYMSMAGKCIKPF